VNRRLVNYRFLTLRPEIKKSNLYWVAAAAILGRFSNNAAVAVRGTPFYGTDQL
jgi:hypothetical protein